MSSSIPVIEVSDDADTFCIGCPYGKVNTLYSVYGHNVRTELFIVFVMPPFTYKVEVKVRKHRQKAIGVIKFRRLSFMRFNLERIKEDTFFVDYCLEETGIMDFFHWIGFLFFHVYYPCFLSFRKKSTYCLLVLSINAVHAENLKWVPVISLDNKSYLFFKILFRHSFFQSPNTFFIKFTPCSLCRSSLFLSFWLVQNLSCDPEQVGRIPDKRE